MSNIGFSIRKLRNDGSELALNVRKSRVFIVIMCMHGSDCYLFSRVMIRNARGVICMQISKYNYLHIALFFFKL